MSFPWSHACFPNDLSPAESCSFSPRLPRASCHQQRCLVGSSGHLPHDSICKGQEKAQDRAWHSVPLSMQGMRGVGGGGGGRLTGQNKARQPQRQLFHQRTPAFDFAACTKDLTTPANRPSKGGGVAVWGGGRKAKASFKLPALARHSLSVRGLCFSVLITHFPEVSRCEGTRHVSSWFL